MKAVGSDSQNNIKRVALFIAILASFLTPFMGSAINMALPTIGDEFNADAILLSWVATSYLLAAAVFLVPFGRIADIYGRKKIFLYGIILFTIASLLSAVSPSITVLIVFRIFQAIGSSMIFGTSLAIITSVFPPGERGKAMGITIAAVYTGLSCGPIVGGFLTEFLGWRSIFYSIIPLGILIIYLVIRKLKGEWAEAKGEKVDWPGSIIYGISLVLLMYGLSKLPGYVGGILVFAGLVFVFMFIAWELKTDNPVLDIRIFKNNKVFAYSNLAALINYGATFAIAFLLNFYFQKIQGMTPRQTGLILVAQPIVMAVFSPFMGRLSDKIEPNIVASIGMAITTVGLCLLIFITNSTSKYMILGILMILGLGFAFFSSPNTNAIMSSVEKRYYGIASGTVGTMRLLGQMLSMGVAMLIFSVFMGKVKITPEVYPQLLKSINVAFAIFTALCFIGIFASLARGKVRKEIN